MPPVVVGALVIASWFLRPASRTLGAVAEPQPAVARIGIARAPQRAAA
jgi:hypothetical protein